MGEEERPKQQIDQNLNENFLPLKNEFSSTRIFIRRKRPY